MRTIAIAANHDVGVMCLKELMSLRADICLVIAQEKDPSEHLTYASVEAAAKKHGLPLCIYSPSRKPELLEALLQAKPDILISVAWRFIFKKNVLSVPKIGAFNFHGSYLPHFRGAHPTNWAILHGAKETGVTLHWMDEGIDTGDIVLQEAFPIGPNDTGQMVRNRQDQLTVQLLRRFYKLLAKGEISRIPQDNAKATYFRKRTPEDGRIEWTKSDREIHNLVRAITKPYPGAFTACGCCDHKVTIWRTQLVGPPRISAAQPGQVLHVLAHSFEITTGNGILQIKDYETDCRIKTGDVFQSVFFTGVSDPFGPSC